MAPYPTTLGGLKTRIITETNRDDLEDDLADALDSVIADAIEFYAAEPWWFNQSRQTNTTTAAVQYVTKPTDVRIIDRPFLIIGAVRYEMTKRSLVEIEGLYSTASTGQPTDWCDYGAQIRLWPTPNTAYTVVWLSDADVTALDYDDDASTSYWTNEAAPLIAARARMIFFRDYFKADADFMRAAGAEQEWYGRIKGETNRRIGTGRTRGSF